MATFGAATQDAILALLATEGAFVSLHTEDPGTTGTGELTATGYARQAITFTEPDGVMSNDDTITFGPAVDEWPEATYFGLWDAVTAGNFVGAAQLDTARTVPALGSASFGEGALEVSFP